MFTIQLQYFLICYNTLSQDIFSSMKIKICLFCISSPPKSSSYMCPASWVLPRPHKNWLNFWCGDTHSELDPQFNYKTLLHSYTFAATLSYSHNVYSGMLLSISGWLNNAFRKSKPSWHAMTWSFGLKLFSNNLKLIKTNLACLSHICTLIPPTNL